MALATPATDEPTTTPAPSDLARKLAGLGDWAAAARRREEQDAYRRTQLIAGLTTALADRSRLLRDLRAQTFALYQASAARRPALRRAGGSRGLDHLLIKLGSFGQALVIARSGLWRGQGRRLHDLRHMAAYARRGPDPRVVPLALVDQAWYLAANADVARSGLAPLVHYLSAGRYENRQPHPLFAPLHYARRNAEALAGAGLTPLEHFVARGAAEGRDPHPLFDIAYYVAQCPALAESGEDPVVHYLETGWASDLSPHPLFDPAWYRRQLPHDEAAQPPLIHYLTVGWRRGLRPHPLFDPAWYLGQYADVAQGGAEPLTHFVESGAAEGRSPSPWFDLPHYVAARDADLAAEANPLIDYLDGGAWGVGEARPGVPTGAYLAARPELVNEGRTPLDHWARLAAPEIKL